MVKKYLISILTICTLILPINVYATQDILTTGISHENSLTQSSVIFEYKKEEQKALTNIPVIGSKAVYIAEPKTGKIIYEKNAHERRYPASTSKILTALVVLENCKLTDKAKVSQKAIDLIPLQYSTVNLVAGEEFSIETLLYALLVPSANEAANVLAEHVSGSIEVFAELCNKRAKELGCESVHFVNPNGIHDENHYCTAYDLYLIAKECQKHDIFNRIVRTRQITIPPTSIYQKNDRTFENTNSLILPESKEYFYESCTGIKTGHTTPAGNCLVASSSKNGIDLISVVLGGDTNSQGLNERFYDTKELFNLAYNNYSIKEIASKNQVIKSVEVIDATKETKLLDIIVDTDISTLVPNNLNKDNVEKVINLENEIKAPIKKNQVLGTITFKADGLNYTTNLIASHEVTKIPYELINLIIIGVICLIVLIVIIILITYLLKKHSDKSENLLDLYKNEENEIDEEDEEHNEHKEELENDDLDTEELDEDEDYDEDNDFFLEDTAEDEFDDEEDDDENSGI